MNVFLFAIIKIILFMKNAFYVTLNAMMELYGLLPLWLVDFIASLLFSMEDFVEYCSLATIAVGYFLFLYTLSGALIYSFQNRNHPDQQTPHRKRVLFVIAHPEDECMYFGPAILNLTKTCDVHVLSLTMGESNVPKERVNEFNVCRKQRKMELYRSCSRLGISSEKITLMSVSSLAGLENKLWNCAVTAKIILDHIIASDFREVYTFDIGGVTGNHDHVSIYFAMALMVMRGDLPSSVTCFALDTVNTLRKYSSFCDSVLSHPLINNSVFVVTLTESSIICDAIRRHVSRMSYSRRLIMIFSRYMVINSFRVMEKEDVLLLLQMPEYDNNTFNRIMAEY